MRRTSQAESVTRAPLNASDGIALLLDEARGIYIPAKFYECFDFDAWGLDRTEPDYQELVSPSKAWYWDVWERLLEKAVHIDEEGKRWTLYQDGSLFALREDVSVNDQGYFLSSND